MSDSKIYQFPKELDVKKLGDSLVIWFRDKKKLSAEGLPAPNGYLVQAQSDAKWKKFIGMDQALQVQLIPTAGNLTVTVGAGKWVDKAVAMGAGMLIFAPLAVTSAIGGWMQNKLPEQTFDFIEQYIINGGKSAMTTDVLPVGKQGEIKCSSCGALNDENGKFCNGCGFKLRLECPICKSTVQNGASFCSNCGGNLKENKQIKCSECGTIVSDGTKFCQECGTKI